MMLKSVGPFLFYKYSKDVVMKRKSNLPIEKKTIRFEMYA